MTDLTFALNYAAGGLDPWGFHVTTSTESLPGKESLASLKSEGIFSSFNDLIVICN